MQRLKLDCTEIRMRLYCVADTEHKRNIETLSLHFPRFNFQHEVSTRANIWCPQPVKADWTETPPSLWGAVRCSCFFLPLEGDNCRLLVLIFSLGGPQHLPSLQRNNTQVTVNSRLNPELHRSSSLGAEAKLQRLRTCKISDQPQSDWCQCFRRSQRRCSAWAGSSSDTRILDNLTKIFASQRTGCTHCHYIGYLRLLIQVMRGCSVSHRIWGERQHLLHPSWSSICAHGSQLFPCEDGFLLAEKIPLKSWWCVYVHQF